MTIMKIPAAASCTTGIVVALLLSPVNAHVRGSERHLEEPVCINTAPFARQDQGCDSLFPICAIADTKTEPAANVAGTVCVKCVNTIDNDVFHDTGCPTEYSQCDAPTVGQTGMSCFQPVREAFRCKNTAAHGGIDEGCSRETPICVDSNTGSEIPSHTLGDRCVACIKVFSEGYYTTGQGDFGCSDPLNYPRCMTVEATDPNPWALGAQCCKANGDCARACPCHELEVDGMWESTVNVVRHPVPEEMMIGCDVTVSKHVAHMELEGLGVRADLAYEGSPMCFTEGLARSIEAGEAMACYNEIVNVVDGFYRASPICPVHES